MGGGSSGKVLILSFKDDEEHIISRILSCQGDESHQRAGGETLQGHKGTQADDKGHRLR